MPCVVRIWVTNGDVFPLPLVYLEGSQEAGLLRVACAMGS